MCCHGQALTGCSGQMLKQGRWGTLAGKHTSMPLNACPSKAKAGGAVPKADALSCSGLDRLLWADAQAGKVGFWTCPASIKLCPLWGMSKSWDRPRGLCLCRCDDG